MGLGAAELGTDPDGSGENARTEDANPLNEETIDENPSWFMLKG